MTTLNVCDKYRTVLTEILPYEVPLLFSNYGFYCILKNDSQRSIFEKQFQTLPYLASRKKENDWYIPFNYRIRKYTSGKSRLLSIIHPKKQLGIVEFYEKNAKYLLYLCNRSPLSIRYISDISKCTFEKTDEDVASDIEEYDEIQIIRNYRNYFNYEKFDILYKFFDSVDFIHLESKYKYCMTLDLAKCFYHIYTHSLSWAVKGKLYSKDNQHSDSLENSFDKLMQHCNYNETNGIVVGPEMSRIFSEIIMQEIDLKIIDDLKSEGLSLGKDYDIRRYVDDSFVFFNDLNYRDVIKEIYEKRCEQYKLYVNEKKIRVISRPFASDITVAKRDVLCLIEKMTQRYLKKDENGAYEKKFKDSVKGLQFFSHELSSIAHRNKVEYGDISRYCLSLIKKILKKELECKNAIPSEGQILSFIEISFFVFSLDMSMSNSVKMAKIIDTIVDISDRLEDDFQKQNVRDRLRREYKRCLDIYISTTREDQTNIDIINILLVIQRKLSLKISDDMMIRIFKLNVDGGYRKLDYFQICSILYFLEDNKSIIYVSLIQEIKERFKIEKPLLYSELALLYFDILSCPLVEDVDKLDILYIIYKQRDRQRLLDVSGKRWFFDWDKNKNISYIIEKKEYIPAYQ